MRQRFVSITVSGLAIYCLLSSQHSLAAARVERNPTRQPAENALHGMKGDDLLGPEATPRNAAEGAPYTASGAADAGKPGPLEELAPAMENQLWLVSTRALPHLPLNSSRRAVPEVSRYQHEAWQRSSLEELMAARDPGLTTAVLIHGNDTDEQEALAKGIGVFQSLSQRADQPFRLIVWSWPADYVRGTMRQDVRLKAERADVDAFYLAQFLDELNANEPVSLVAFSLGARITAGALHLLGGGALGGRTMAVERAESRPPIRAVLMAPAVDDDSLLPGRRHGRALAVVERMVLLVNPRDRVLRWYRFVSPRSGATALGSHGLTSLAALGPFRQKIEQIDVHPLLGGQHGWSSYAGSPEILEQLKREILIGSARRNVAAESARGRTKNNFLLNSFSLPGQAK